MTFTSLPRSTPPTDSPNKWHGCTNEATFTGKDLTISEVKAMSYSQQLHLQRQKCVTETVTHPLPHDRARTYMTSASVQSAYGSRSEGSALHLLTANIEMT